MRATERIRDGHADEVLSEAVALASSPEAKEAIEQVDRNALLGLQAEQGDEAPRIEIWAGVDVETVMERNELPSGEELVDVLLYPAVPVIRVLQTIVAALQFTHDPKGKLLDLAEEHLAAMQAFVESVEAARVGKKHPQEPPGPA